MLSNGKRLACLVMATLIFFLHAASAHAVEPASIEDHGTYFAVSLDYTAATPRQVGESYGRAIRTRVPEFERLWDSYIKEMGVNWIVYQIVMRRVRQLRKQMPAAYCEEIDGIASQLTGGKHNRFGDGKVSRDELYMLNLIGDVSRVSQCCAVGVYGARTRDGQPICGRNLDWPDGQKHQLAQLQTVTTFKHGDRSLVTIGCIGFQALATGFNNKGVFAGVLDSGTGAKYKTKKRRSYLFDLRTALLNSSKLEEVAAFMASEEKKYVFNHLIVLADKQSSAVLENNFSGAAENHRRALRHPEDELHRGMEWGISDAVGAVNCFVLRGNCDNHINPFDACAVRKGATDRDMNTPRWQTMRLKLAELGEKVDTEGVKSILSYYHPETRGDMYKGDLYNTFTFQSIVFRPDTLELEVAFRPKDGTMPAKPNFQPINTGLFSIGNLWPASQSNNSEQR